jgi:hypothetical protein
LGKVADNAPFDHLSETIDDTNNHIKFNKIQSIFNKGQQPIIKIFWKDTEDEAYDLEAFLVNFWGRKIIKTGPLTNVKEGGKVSPGCGAGMPKSEISRQRMSEAKKKQFADNPESHPRLGKKQSAKSIATSKEVNSDNWEVITPTGQIETVKNLKEYCKSKGLNYGNLVDHGASGYKARNLNPKASRKKSDSARAAISNARSKTFIMTFPDGHEETIKNLSKFCRDHSLVKTNFYMGWDTKGFKARKVPNP